MSEMNVSILLMIVTAVVGFAVGWILRSKKDDLKEQKKRLKASEQDHAEEDNE